MFIATTQVRAEDEQRAIARLVTRGAVVKRFDQKATGIEGLLVRLGDDYGVDRRIIHADGTVDNEVIKWLKELEHLTLEIRGTTLSDDGLKQLAALTHLEGLDVGGSNITDAGVEHINAFEELVLLDLSLTSVTDAGLAKLHPRISLGTLSLQNTPMTERSLPQLLKFNGLKSIFLPATFSEKTVKAFAERVPDCRVVIVND